MAQESRVMQPLSRTILWPLLVLTLVGSTACTKDAADETDANENANTGPTAQEELCADYPDNIACPTLPAPPQLEDGTDFSEWEPSQCPAVMPDFGKPGCIVIGDPCPEGDWPERPASRQHPLRHTRWHRRWPHQRDCSREYSSHAQWHHQWYHHRAQ